MLKRTLPLLILAIALSQATLPAQQNDTITEGQPAELNVNYTAPPKSTSLPISTLLVWREPCMKIRSLF